MSAVYAHTTPIAAEFFASARAHAAQIEQTLTSPAMMGAAHEQVEELLVTQGREWARRMLEAHLALRAQVEVRLRVVNAEHVELTTVRDSLRHLETLLGRVQVPRLAYQAPGATDLHPLDAALNLPPEIDSHGVRRLVAKEAARASFDEVVELVREQSGAKVGKRQIEALAARAAQDFDVFYATRTRPCEATEDLLVLTTDAKGIVMRHADLREATRRKAEAHTPKFGTRLAPGEKPDRKRMAQVASVYTIARWPRTSADVLSGLRTADTDAARPTPRDKRVWASVEKQPRRVIRSLFDEAQARDPEHRRQWVVLVDGAKPQLRAVKAEAKRRGVRVTIVVDVIHVLEYLWKAGHALFGVGTEAESWVSDRFLGLLTGRSGGETARTIRWWAKRQGIAEGSREDKQLRRVCGYLANRTRTRLLDYARALREGLPIATGVIEGVCRYLVKDRMDRTGACWSVRGAEAVLRLRALRASGDFDAYWAFHLERERERHHAVAYADHVIPNPLPAPRTKLQRVK
jgi:hypothetical protein